MLGFYYSFFAVFLYSCCINAEKYCWDSTWYNDSVTFKNGSNYEHQSVDVLQTICPHGAAVVAARCQDVKKESFTGMKNDTYNRNIVTCHYITGLICQPYKNDTNATCPDYAIQYGCRCPPSTPSGGATKSMTHAPGTGTPRLTTYSWSAAGKTATESKTTGETGSGNVTGTSADGSKSATSSRRHRFKNSAETLKNVGLLVIVSVLMLIKTI